MDHHHTFVIIYPMLIDNIQLHHSFVEFSCKHFLTTIDNVYLMIVVLMPNFEKFEYIVVYHVYDLNKYLQSSFVFLNQMILVHHHLHQISHLRNHCGFVRHLLLKNYFVKYVVTLPMLPQYHLILIIILFLPA